MVSIRWIGAAGLEITFDHKVVLIDPYLSRPGKREVFFGHPRSRPEVVDRYVRGLAGDIAALVVSHTHLDHVLDAPALAPYVAGPVLGSHSLRNLMALHGAGERVRVCRGGERISLGGGASVTLIPSVHGKAPWGRVSYPGEIAAGLRLPLKARDYRHGQVFIVQLEIGGRTFLHIGTNAFDPAGMAGRRCDVLFLCVPGWKKDPAYSDGLIKGLAPGVVVPFHYDDISSGPPLRPGGRFLPFQDLRGLERAVKHHLPDVEVKWLKPFETAVF